MRGGLPSLPGARLPRRTHPEVSGVVPRAACRRSMGERVHGSCGVASDLRHDDAQTLRCQFAAFRLTGSVSGFHDPSLVSVMGGDSGRAQFARALHGAGTPVLGPMDGAHERTTRQSCDELPVHSADSVCGAR